MTTDYRTELQPLFDALNARAALAAEPEPPADGEVAELVAWLWSMYELAGECNPDEQCRYARAADLLEHLAEPACVVLRPSPELIEAFKAAGPGRIEAIGRLAPQPMPEGPVPVSERLPGSKDCDEKGQVWAWRLFDPEDDDNGDFWALVPSKWLNRSHWTHWLPATALAEPAPLR